MNDKFNNKNIEYYYELIIFVINFLQQFNKNGIFGLLFRITKDNIKLAKFLINNYFFNIYLYNGLFNEKITLTGYLRNNEFSKLFENRNSFILSVPIFKGNIKNKKNLIKI
jgi:hypothetical protein